MTEFIETDIVIVKSDKRMLARAHAAHLAGYTGEISF